MNNARPALLGPSDPEILRTQSLAELIRMTAREVPLKEVFERATERVAQALRTDYAEVFELFAEDTELMLRTGLGWKTETEERVTLPVNEKSQLGFTALHGGPLRVRDFSKDPRFRFSPMIRKWGIKSGISAQICGKSGVYGVLAAHSREPFDFSDEEADWIQSMADVLAVAIEARRAQERESESVHRFTALNEALPAGVWQTDTRGNLVYINDYWERFAGVPKDRLMGTNWREGIKEVLHPLDYRNLVKEFDQVLGTRRGFSSRVRIRKAGEGEFCWHLIRGEPICEPSGGCVSGWAGTTTDIDLFIEAQNSLEEEYTRMARLIQDAPIGIAVLDRELRFVVINRALAKLDGAPCERHFGRTPREAIPSHGALFEELYRTAFETRRPILNHEVRLESKFVANISPLVTPSGERLGVMAFLTDIGAQISTEIERESLLTDLETSVRARDEFIAIASHELRTPLTSLRLQIQLLLKMLGPNPPKASPNASSDRQSQIILLESADRQVRSLNRLIEDMLDVARITEGRFELEREPVNLGELVHEVVARVKSDFEARELEIRESIEEGLVGAFDRLRMDQVVTNLVSNAVKYGNRQPIDIELRRSGLGEVQLIVQDRGIGVPEQDQKKIFERFHRAAEASHFSGLGLGLYIIRQIVNRHGGSVSLKSEHGKGTIFIVRLPLRGWA